MRRSSFKSALLVAMSLAFLTGYHSLSYVDLEALGINCPDMNRCQGYRNHLTYMDRSCECDFNCTAYKDCCIDALSVPAQQDSRPPPRTDVKCLHYGEGDHTDHKGVFAISRCNSNWRGSRQIRQLCHGPVNFSDPLVAAPVTDVVRNVTYRNLACAECNYADLTSLKTFQLKLCNGLSNLPQEQIMGDLTYNEELDLWGVMRLNRFGNASEFFGCDIYFDVPDYLNSSVRFCRSNLISGCASDWNRPAVARMCSAYTAVVYSNTAAYKNPHCAICNNKSVDQVSCGTDLLQRKRPMSFALLLDVNPTDGEEVGMRPVPTPACPRVHKYDPFFKKCRQLACALPGHVVRNNRCVKA